MPPKTPLMVNSELQEKLHELAEANAELLRLSHDAILVWRVEGGIESWNLGAEELYGFSAEEAFGREPDDLLRTTFPRGWDEIEAALRAGKGWAGELRHLTKSGQAVTVSAKLQLVLGDDGVERVLETNRDITDAKRVEGELARARERAEWVARLPNENPDPVLRLGCDFTLLYANDAARTAFGELGLVDGGPAPVALAEPARCALATRQPREREIPCGERVFSMTFAPVGAEVNLYGQDVTLRKRAEEALRESERRFRTLAENAPDLVARFDRDLRCAYLNPQMTRQLHFPPEAVLGKRVTELGLSVELAALWEANLREVFESARPKAFELQQTAHAGLLWLDVRMVPEIGEDGAVDSVLSISRDITERRRAELDLSRSREGLRRLLETSVRVVRETALDGLLRVISGATLELTGARIATCGHGFVNGQLGLGVASRAAGAPDCPAGQAFVMEKGGVYLDLVEGRDSVRLTDEELRAHPRWWGLPGDHVPMRGLLGVRLTDDRGRMNGMILATDKAQGEFTQEDESLLRQLAAIASLALQHVEAHTGLEEADRRKNEFLAMLSHELRNPLAPIRNSLYVLDQAPPGGEQARRAREVIGRQVAHMTRLVDDLLDMTRISRGKIQLQREALDLGDVVRRAAEDHRQLFRQNGVELEVAVPERRLSVHGDATRLAQVIGNLLHNAAKFTGRGGRASISVEETERGHAIIRVLDTGVGISEEILPRLFEPFTQADSTLDRSRGGLGLGLALVKAIVELHGGRVAAKSVGQEAGAEFSVTLPLDRTAAEPRAAVAAAAGAPASRRVLVVEDNVDAAESLREALELGSHEVEVAFTGPEGIEKARRFRPEVVLCDIGLPGMDGYAVARALRSDPTLRPAYLVALTGYAMPDDVARARDAGFDEHLAKPPELERIARLIASAPARVRTRS